MVFDATQRIKYYHKNMNNSISSSITSCISLLETDMTHAQSTFSLGLKPNLIK